MEKKFKRTCPACNKDLLYKSKESYNFCLKANTKCRSCSTKKYAKRIGDASFLLNESLESYYWLGFILADGHIQNGRLSITLSDKDSEHLIKLAKHLCVDVHHKVNNKKYGATILSIMHKDVINTIVNRFDIKSNKTIDPPNKNVFENLDFDKLFSIFVGFIDGDGNITKLHNRPDFHIRIKTHANWLTILSFFNDKLRLGGLVKINNQGYATLDINNTINCKEIKKIVITYNLPILERKWSEIDLNFIGRNELANRRLNEIKNMLNLDFDNKTIYQKLNISSSTFYQIIKRNKLK
jgi:hypothetical protein